MALGGIGLALIGMLGTSAMADKNIPDCTHEITGHVADNPTHCRGENHIGSYSSECKCPNPNNSKDPNQELTKKCAIRYYNTVTRYTCQKP